MAMKRSYWSYLTVGLLFLVLATILVTFRDYGLTWDEEVEKLQGWFSIRWYTSFFQDKTLFNYDYRFYGSFFNIVANLASTLVPLGIYETRHLINALFGMLGLWGAYKVGAHLLNNKAGFFSVLFLILTPRYYGHMFNNPKDIPFAALYVISLYFLLKTIDHLPSPPRSLLFKLSMAIGLTLGIRLGGALLFVYLAFVLGGWLYLSWREKSTKKFHKSQVQKLSLFFLKLIVFSFGIMILWWPWIQSSPIINTIQGLKYVVNVPENLDVFFRGSFIPADQLPRSYIFTWLLISLPEFYILPLILSVIPLSEFWKTQSKKIRLEIKHLKIAVVVLSVFLPLLAVFLFNSTLYDGMRHILFIVPSMAVLAALSFTVFIKRPVKKGVKRLVFLFMGVFLSLTLTDMVDLHPYQSIYFNRLGAGGLLKASNRYETDYWGQTYKEGVEWVLKNYKESSNHPIRVANCTVPFLTGYYLEKSPLNHGRFVTVPREGGSHIFLSTTRWLCFLHHPGRLLHIVSRKNTPLLYVIETKNPTRPNQKT